ncbi:MAG: Type phosphodiesterase / nucleotide pyrophosphatase, partial [Bryobacterales bacterium]|nr:Type phosphodiesterase / nucleotide pyrophosphatase [Bryobacterales bacterium]
MGRVILFGLDGGTYTVLDSLIDRGVMPFLGRFMKSGVRGVLQSTTPPLTPPAWCSLVTGRSPGNHGITGFFQYESERSLVIEIVSATKLHAETLWSIVSRQGKRAGSLNFAVHHPAPRVDGYVIPGWVPWRWLKRLSHPKGLVERLNAEVPGFDVKALAMDFDEEKKSIAGEPVEDPEGWIALHIRRERQWFQVFEHQLKNDPCDLVGIVFDGVDKLQHLLWPYLDPSNSVDLGPDQDRIRSHCFNYFRQIDDFLERTVLMAGSEATVMVVSDHGFTGTSDILFINTWLESRGYLVWNEDAPFLPGGSQELETDFYKLSAFDMSRTRAFALTASSNGINIVVRGRKTEHGIAPDEYESFRNRLMNELLTDCVDPETGKPLIDKITPREEAFAGPYMGVAPDLT